MTTVQPSQIETGTGVGDIPALVDIGGGVSGLPGVDGSLLTGIATAATTVTDERLLNIPPGVGTSGDYAREDHTHGSPTSATVAAASDYAGRFEAVSISTGDIGTNLWGWWWDTINLKLHHVRNRAGTLYAVEANPL